MARGVAAENDGEDVEGGSRRVEGSGARRNGGGSSAPAEEGAAPALLGPRARCEVERRPPCPPMPSLRSREGARARERTPLVPLTRARNSSLAISLAVGATSPRDICTRIIASAAADEDEDDPAEAAGVEAALSQKRDATGSGSTGGRPAARRSAGEAENSANDTSEARRTRGGSGRGSGDRRGSGTADTAAAAASAASLPGPASGKTRGGRKPRKARLPVMPALIPSRESASQRSTEAATAIRRSVAATPMTSPLPL